MLIQSHDPDPGANTWPSHSYSPHLTPNSTQTPPRLIHGNTTPFYKQMPTPWLLPHNLLSDKNLLLYFTRTKPCTPWVSSLRYKMADFYFVLFPAVCPLIFDDLLISVIVLFPTNMQGIFLPNLVAWKHWRTTLKVYYNADLMCCLFLVKLSMQSVCGTGRTLKGGNPEWWNPRNWKP